MSALAPSVPRSSPPLAAHGLPSSLDPKIILASLVERTSQILHATRTSIVRTDLERHPGRAFVFTAVDDPALEGYSLVLADYPEISAAIDRDRPVVVRDDAGDEIAALIRQRHRKLPFPLSVLLPISANGRSFGVLFLRFAEANVELRPADVEFCELVCFAAAVALHNAREHETTLAELRRREHEAERLEEAHRLRMEMLASASHDLRTPLHSMIGYVGLLLEEAYGAVGAEQRQVLGFVSEGAQTLLTIVDNLIDHAQIEEGRFRLEISDGEITHLLEDLRFTIEPLALDRPVEIRFESSQAIPTVRTDWGKLRRILLNLVHNALKFTERGRVTIAAGTENGRVWLEVSDTGPGIAPDRLEEIFERFYRVEPTREQGPGGLGLSIVKLYCGLLQGTVAVESRRGEGSRFRVSIPLRFDAAPPAAA